MTEPSCDLCRYCVLKFEPKTLEKYRDENMTVNRIVRFCTRYGCKLADGKKVRCQAGYEPIEWEVR